MTIEEQLQHLKDIRHVLQSIKKQALLPNAQDYRATNRDAIEFQLNVGIPLVQALIEENARQTLQQEEVQALRVAKERVASDMPSVHVEEAQLFQYHEHTKRWYVEVGVMHYEEAKGAATVLCRVSYDASGHLSAMRVDIVERPSHATESGQ